MKIFITTVIFSLAFCGYVFAQPQIGLDKVKEIKLLESNRDDVLKILASYKLDAREKYLYDDFSTKDARISVIYSEGNCEIKVVDDFRVPEWKAIHVSIEPNNPIKFKDLKINPAKYKKEKRYYNSDEYYVYYDKEAGIIFSVFDGKIIEIEFVPPSRYYNLMCNQEKAAKLRATASIFEEPLKDRSGTIICPVVNVTELHLNRNSITSCDSSTQNADKPCAEGSQIIHVQALAVDPEGDVLIYIYKVSAGKITGTGEKVMWDLTGVKPGFYTITAAVDDGCGVCGTTQTKTITVR